MLKLFGAAVLAATMTLSSAIPAGAIGTQLFASLFSGNERPSIPPSAANGTASVVIVNATTICWSLLLTGGGGGVPTAAHIHRGGPGVVGPVVVPLLPPASTTTGFRASCRTGLPAALVSDIRLNPSNYYVNIHTSAFATGYVRGQLF